MDGGRRRYSSQYDACCTAAHWTRAAQQLAKIQEGQVYYSTVRTGEPAAALQPSMVSTTKAPKPDFVATKDLRLTQYSSALEDFYTVSPSLQALVLCHDPSTHRLSATAPFSLPIISAVDPPNNHFVRLGLLHPLGGGKLPLDALAVVDKRGRRRLVLPFGWGAGKHADTPAGRSIQNRMMVLLKHCIETLEGEA